MGSTSVTEGEDSADIYYDKFILDGTTLYSTPALMDSARTYAYKFKNVTANATQTLNFTAREGEYVFYQEAEDITGWNHVDDLPRMSGGAGAYPSEESTVTTLPAGKYKVYVGTRGNTSTSYVVKAGTTELLNRTMQGYIQETASSEFEISESTAITVSVTGGSNTRGIDYILVEKTGDYIAPPTVTATVYEDNIVDDTQYTGADAGATYSVFKATVTAGTNAITSLYFTLNNGAKSTDEYNETTITEGSSAIFGLIVPMASANVTDITAVIDGDSYVAFE